jgi:hypothetical protein
VLSCDYNGWNDAPEDEREALDAYEAAAEKARVAVDTPPHRTADARAHAR